MCLRDPLGGRGMPDERCRRPDGPPGEVAAAVRAASVEDALCAIDAERALEGADPREVAVGWQVAVAALAVRAELEHPRKSSRGAAVSRGRERRCRRARRDAGAPRPSGAAGSTTSRLLARA